MKLFEKPIFILLFILIGTFKINAQPCGITDVQHLADIPSTCSEITMTMIHDQSDMPYLYIANKEGGLKIMDVSNPSPPLQVSQVPVSELNGLDVINLSQSGSYLYLALGNIFNNNQLSGMAIIDVTDPINPNTLDVWDSYDLFGGAGVVAVEGNYAYLGAMGNGLMTLDVSDKTNIVLLSQFVPDISFPDPIPDPPKYNARGMAVKNDVVYVCYDAGGLRIIDVSDKMMPVEIGRFSNPELNGLPRAYNNIILDGDLVYIAVDYCGLEILNISDPSQITLTGWWNPWDCQSNPLNWFSSPGHMNEMAYNPDCNTLFLSSGKSDLYAVDISDPTQPDSCFSYGGVSNGIGTWGVSAYGDKIFLSYICAFIPFASNWTGVKILEYENNCVNDIVEEKPNSIEVFPNPVSGLLNIKMPAEENHKIILYNYLGQIVYSKKIEKYRGENKIDFSNLGNGVYYLLIDSDGRKYGEKVLNISGTQ